MPATVSSDGSLPGSLLAPLLARERDDPGSPAVVFIDCDGVDTPLDVAGFLDCTRAFAAVLRDRGVEPGDRVLIALPHCRAMVFAFWGAVWCGAVPSIFPYADPAAFRRELRELALTADVAAMVVGDDEHDALEALTAGTGCRVIAAAEVIDARSSMLAPAERLPSQPAYLQYTSGTTGMRKGVVLSHGAIRRFVAAFSEALAIGPEDVSISWLPLYHDYGLFAGMVLPLSVGIPAVLMSPFKWVRNPAALFQAAHRHRATLTWAPNAAYLHAVRAVTDRAMEGVDLGRLRAWVSGGEPVLHGGQRRFLERFSRFGLRESALLAGYGMAENTLSVTVGRPGRRGRVDWVDGPALQVAGEAVETTPDMPGARAVVSCGPPIRGARVRIVGAHGVDLTERRVGEVLVRTDTLFSGYFERPDLTEQLLIDGWYHSGDLGYLADGELYVCGRKKDLIKVAGHGIHPQDVEAVAAELPQLRPGRVVAFGIEDPRLGSEKVILVADLAAGVPDSERLDIERELRRRVHHALELTLAEVHLFRGGWVLRTANGKMARAANRRKYLELRERGSDAVCRSRVATVENGTT